MKKQTFKQIGMFLCILFTSMATSFLYYGIFTALPAIMNELLLDQSEVHWINSAYSIAMGSAIFGNIYLSKRFPAKKIYLTALFFMVLGLVVSGISKGFAFLLVGRILQAFGNGVTISLAQQLLYEMYPNEKKGWILGWYGFVISISSALSPVVSGILTDQYGWKMIFWSGLGLLGLSMILSVCFLKSILKIDKKPRLSFCGICHVDYFDSVVKSCVLFLIMMWGNTWMPLYLQRKMFLSATDSGLVLLPGALLIACMNPVAGKLYDHNGIKKIGIYGAFLLVIPHGALLFLDTYKEVGSWVIGVLFVIRGIGIGLLMMPLVTDGLKAVSKESIAVGNGVLLSLRTMAGALGSGIAGNLEISRCFLVMILGSLLLGIPKKKSHGGKTL